DHRTFTFESAIFGMLLPYPATNGIIWDYRDIIAKAKDKGGIVTLVCDVLGLCLLASPQELGADIAVGSCQRFGVPMGYGGPHAAFFAVKEEYKRRIPGRIIGVSQDANGDKALRLALQTREQ